MNGTSRCTMLLVALALTLLAFSPLAAARDPVASSAAADPCGPVQEPVCWTTRFACYYYGPPVERVVRDTLLKGIDADPDDWQWSACERQPGTRESGGPPAVAPASAAGAPCGVVDEPACWTARFACYYYGPPVERTLKQFIDWAGEVCERQSSDAVRLPQVEAPQPASSSSVACGMVDEPVCWTARFACYYYGPPVERALGQMIPWAGEACERQPAAGDAVDVAEPAPASAAGGACGLVQDPVCWTVRFACYYVGPPVERALYPYVRMVFYCPTQPSADAVAVMTDLSRA